MSSRRHPAPRRSAGRVTASRSTRTLESSGRSAARSRRGGARRHAVVRVRLGRAPSLSGYELLAPVGGHQVARRGGYELSEADGPVLRARRRRPAGRRSACSTAQSNAESLSVAEASGRFFSRRGRARRLVRGRQRRHRAGPSRRVGQSRLPHLWIWREVRASGGRWRGQAEMLGLEPASVPHSLGLARAVAEGQASRARPPASALRSRIVATPFRRAVRRRA